MASTKRTSAESTNDAQKSQPSDLLYQKEDNAKREEFSPLSDTTLHDLPIEMLYYVLVKAVAMEVKGMKLAKCAWKEKADLVISRLKTVCSQWSTILTTDFFRNELHRTLDSTAPETIRLEILHQSPTDFDVDSITAMKDEIFVLGSRLEQDCVINVYDRNNMAKVKDVIPLPGRRPVDVIACSVSNCVYVVSNESNCCSIFRITKDEEHKFYISNWSNDHREPSAPISVSANGNVVILSEQEGLDSHVISIYNANGSLQHEIMLSQDTYKCLEFMGGVFQKSNGNLVLVAIDGHIKLIEIDTSGNIVRQHQSSQGGDSCVNFADIYGRIMITDPLGGMELIDSEFNLLDFSIPQMDEDQFCYLYYLQYNSDRNEVLCSSAENSLHGVLTIFRFIEE